MSTKICKKCDTEKEISFFSKHSGTKDKLDNRCKECVKEIKKISKESGIVKEYKIYDFDYNSYDWQVGKVSGSILEKEKRYESRIKIEGKIKSKSFAFDKFKNKDEALKEAELWLKNTSDENELTRNQIRKLDDDTIEVRLTKDQIMKTDIKFLDLCQKYTLNSTKSGDKDSQYYAILSIQNKTIRFHNYITNFEMVDHINRNPLDNRIINLQKSNHKLNNNNRNGPKKNEDYGIVGVKFDMRYDSFVARIKQDGKEYSKSFNIKKLGYDEAKEKAINYRKELCEKFNCKNGL